MKALVALIVGAGAVAAAIGAILALWPDPTPELRAELSDVIVDRNVTLDEYAARHETAGASAPSAPAAMQLAAYLAAATTPESTTTTETTPEETTTDEDDEETTPTETTDDTTPTETTPTGGTTTSEEGELSVVLTEESRERLGQGVRGALSDPALAEVDLGKVCSRSVNDQNCGLRTHVVYMQVVDEDGSPREVDAETVAEQLGALLTATRTQPVSAAGSSVQPIGVTVNFNISLTGFRDRKVAVRWSLHDAAGGGRVSRDWLRNQPALWLVGEAEKDSASSDFWVPLPKLRGPFFIRVSVYDEDGVRLDFVDTTRVG